MTDSTSEITPTPKPVSAEQVILALLKSNKAEREDAERCITRAQDDVALYTDEAARLDAIREGLDAALQAVRYPRSVGQPSA